jgi:hypothetical protein
MIETGVAGAWHWVAAVLSHEAVIAYDMESEPTFLTVNDADPEAPAAGVAGEPTAVTTAA